MIELTQMQHYPQKNTWKEKPISVNAYRVESVAIDFREGNTVITFGKDDFVIVKESYGYVLGKMKEILND